MEPFEVLFGDFIVKGFFFFFFFMDFIGKILMDLKFICGYLITLYSIILLLIISKIGCTSKSLLWVWGVTLMSFVLMRYGFEVITVRGIQGLYDILFPLILISFSFPNCEIIMFLLVCVSFSPSACKLHFLELAFEWFLL